MRFLEFLRTLARHLRPYRAQSVVLFILLLIDVIFTTAWPLGFMVTIDTVLPTRDGRLLTIVIGTLVVGVAVASAASLGRDYLYAYLSSNVLHDIRLTVFTHLQRLSLDFYARVGTGDIMARFSSDLAAIEHAIVMAMPSTILSALIIAIGAVLLFWLEWRLAVLTVVGLAVCVLIPRGFARRATTASYEAKQKQGRLADAVQENITAQPVVKAFGLERHAAAAFGRQSTQLAYASRRFGFLSYVVERLPSITILTFEIVVIGTGIVLVFYGYQKLGTIVAFHAMFLYISASVTGLANGMPAILHALAGFNRLDDVLNERPMVPESVDARPVAQFSHSIRLEHVSFGYTTDHVSLDDTTIDVHKGQFVALVGSSGSGKSTILNLILRFYDPSSGRVLIDAHDLREVTLDSLRGQIGVVFQESILFNLSVRENVRLGDPRALNAEIETAMRAAEIHDVVMSLPDGYDTLAGQRGSRFSGGQRQRLALARALVRNPAILLLDEATSALDPVSEAAINETLRRVASGHTVISVTHRLSTVTHADRIYVLDHGRIAEHGRHDDLLRRGGLYAQLWRKQTGFTLNTAGDEAGVDAERLRDIPILSQLDDAILVDLAGKFVTERYPAERSVIVQEDPGSRFYIIVRGVVDVLRHRPDGGVDAVAVLSDGDYFGEIALLEDVPRTATVVTRAPTVFLSLDRLDFWILLERAPELRETLTRRSAAPGGR
jgi:ATP-binding cassette subfamily B protein